MVKLKKLDLKAIIIRHTYRENHTIKIRRSINKRISFNNNQLTGKEIVDFTV